MNNENREKWGFSRSVPNILVGSFSCSPNTWFVTRDFFQRFGSLHTTFYVSTLSMKDEHRKPAFINYETTRNMNTSEFAKIYFRYRKFSHDVTAPTLVSQINPVGVGLFPYEALSFGPIHLHGYRRRDWKRSIEARSDFGKKVPNGAWTQSSRSEYSPTTPACVSRYWKMEEKFALMENLTKFLWEDALSQSGLLKRVNRHHAIVREALGTRYKRGQQFSIAWNVAACIVVNFTAWRDHVRFI